METAASAVRRAKQGDLFAEGGEPGHHRMGAPRPVAIIGELNVDLIASGLTSAPILGREILAEDFQTVLGSASAIFACGAARLGHPVTFISKVGDDDYGRFCINALQEAGISAGNVAKVQTSKTGVTISLSTPSDRAFVTILGAISELRYKDIDLQALRGHSHLHMTSFFLQTACARPSRAFCPGQKARPHHVVHPPQTPRLRGALTFGGGRRNHHSFYQSGRSASSHEEEQCARSAQAVGRKSALRSGQARSPRSHRGGQWPGRDCAVVQSFSRRHNRRRRSFAAGFVHAFLSGRDLHGCLVEGNACGALSTQQVGGTAGQPGLESLERFLHRNFRRRR